jgi:hypothetical protein
LNEIVTSNAKMARELERVGTVVGSVRVTPWYADFYNQQITNTSSEFRRLGIHSQEISHEKEK